MHHKYLAERRQGDMFVVSYSHRIVLVCQGEDQEEKITLSRHGGR